MRYDLDLDSGVVYPGTTMVDLAKIAADAVKSPAASPTPKK